MMLQELARLDASPAETREYFFPDLLQGANIRPLMEALAGSSSSPGMMWDVSYFEYHMEWRVREVPQVEPADAARRVA